MLTFNKLAIEVSKWRDDKTPTGEIEFMNDDTKINIKLTPEDCKAMLQIVAHRMVQHVQDAAQHMSADIINAIPTSRQIENKE